MGHPHLSPAPASNTMSWVCLAARELVNLTTGFVSDWLRKEGNTMRVDFELSISLNDCEQAGRE